MNLNDVHHGICKNKSRRRVGRGPGSGRGKTASRGSKGQGSRSGSSTSPVFEGGQMPLVRRIPKRGFNNKWADTVAIVQDEQNESSFTGVLASMEGDAWLISGTAVVVNEETALSEGLSIGDAVRVTFAAQEDGTWLALQIESLQETPESEQTPTAELDSTPSPTGETVGPETPTVETTGTVTVEPAAEDIEAICTAADPHPTGTTLAQRYGVPYEEIMGWFCQHFGFGEIDLAYGLSQETGIPVADIFAMRRSGLGWGEIKQQLQDASGQSMDKGQPTGRPEQTKPTQKPKPTRKPKPTQKPK